MVFRPQARQQALGLDRAVPCDPQVVAYAIGDRGEQTCRKLWEAIRQAYQTGHCYIDFWEAYNKVIPDEQHTACGKDSGQTAHVEQWNSRAASTAVSIRPQELVVLEI